MDSFTFPCKSMRRTSPWRLPHSMSRELLLLRHAKSDWATGAGHDFERGLNKRGRRASKQMGRWMRTEQMVPDFIVSSDAERAMQTTLRVWEFGEFPEDIIEWERSVYEASLDALLNVLAEVPESSGTTLVVGHNPGIEYLVRYLADESLQGCDQANLIPTASLSHLMMPPSWDLLEHACAKLVRIARPRQLFEE